MNFFAYFVGKLISLFLTTNKMISKQNINANELYLI